MNRLNRSIFITTLVALALVFSFGTASAVIDVELPEQGVYDDFTEIYERVSPSVVAISVFATPEEMSPEDFPEDFPFPELFPDEDGDGEPDLPPPGPVQSGGSGFIIDTQGHIVTNHHVVEGADRIEISFVDGTLARAEIVGLDPDSDLAVLEVDLPEDYIGSLTPLEFAPMEELQIGQPVLAIGSPFGQRWTLTSGIISALDRTIPGLTQFSIGGVIQTDAPINPGNSGGPLLDLEGRVIGVNAQINTTTGANSGVGFAIPSDLVERVAATLIEDGFVSYSYLGISGSDVSLAQIEALDAERNLRGVVVATVMDGGPADLAGLEASEGEADIDGLTVPTDVDVITHINGEPLNGIGSLISYLARNTEPGDRATLTVMRFNEDGTSEEIELEVRLTPRPTA